MRNKNSNRDKYKPPVGISREKHTQIVSRVVDMLNEMRPVDGYGTGEGDPKDGPVLRAILDYLASEGIHPESLPSIPGTKTRPIRRK